MTEDFAGSVCPRKEDAHKKMRAISGIDLSIEEESRNRTPCPIVVRFLQGAAVSKPPGRFRIALLLSCSTRSPLRYILENDKAHPV
jgi:hypothetical protein